MSKELEELEQQFILKNDIEHGEIDKLIKMILEHCKIDEKGFVQILDDSLPLKDKLLLILCARYLGKKLQEKLKKDITISEEVSTKELIEMVHDKSKIISARLTGIKKRVVFVKRGVYKVSSHEIKKFLISLKK